MFVRCLLFILYTYFYSRKKADVGEQFGVAAAFQSCIWWEISPTFSTDTDWCYLGFVSLFPCKCQNGTLKKANSEIFTRWRYVVTNEGRQ
jgi:hypothetical protein